MFSNIYVSCFVGIEVLLLGLFYWLQCCGVTVGCLLLVGLILDCVACYWLFGSRR